MTVADLIAQTEAGGAGRLPVDLAALHRLPAGAVVIDVRHMGKAADELTEYVEQPDGSWHIR